ncbi:MAG: GTPase HflX [Myxococcales bacterium]|jgi:GTP-binding protein HflX|nr:GTPase HflX [Myxococcales bacterium]
MPDIYGNTAGLGPSALRALERIYRRRVPPDSIATPELVRSLADASREAGRQVGVLVHRSGVVDYVVVGTSTGLMLPDIGRLRAAQGRFRALRLVHTHLFNEGLTHDDLTDLTRLRLDLVCAVLLSPGGDPRSLTWAYNVPSGHKRAEGAESRGGSYEVVPPQPWGRPQPHFGQLIGALEDEFSRLSKSRTIEAKDGRAILVHVGEKSHPGAMRRARSRMDELASLAHTAGVEVIDRIIQLRDRIDPKLVLGKGKLEQVVIRAIDLDAETLIFDHDLSPAQASGIAAHTDLKVIDRSQLILDIFAQRAETRDGKLQVELAQLKYTLPRLGQRDDALSRLTGGIGGRGPGETTLEIGRRRARERLNRLERQLTQLERQRSERRRRRQQVDVPVVAIVGYTNAGKSTLLNTLTRAGVLAEDKLFATLDTRSRRLELPSGAHVILTDTVGFIRDMPKDLFAAFRATFEEAADANLLLELIDASDPEEAEHRRTTQELLDRLELRDVPRLRVFNKVDRLDEAAAEDLAFDEDAVLVSALDRSTIPPLLARIEEALGASLRRRATHDGHAWTSSGSTDPELLDELADH